jgi:DNA-binding transcriptional MerR regulator
MTDPVALPEDQEQFKLNEVCKLANVQPYMLRFWGTEFPQLEAAKSGTGQRLYTRDQVETILEIRRLLFDEGLTIAGARKKLDSRGGTSKPKAPVGEAQQADAEKAPDAEAPEPEPAAEEEPKKAAPAAAKTTTSSARRTVKKKAKPAAASTAGAAEVDKKAADDVQPLLATLKSVRDEIDTIVTELKGK